MTAITSYYKSENRDFTIVNGDCFDVLTQFDFKFDMIFADPPYFLSNGGISYQAGKVVCVDKGDWDKGTRRNGTYYGEKGEPFPFCEGKGKLA